MRKNMANIVKLNFEVICECDGNPDELGEELAAWLQESWFNGEDVLEVNYKGSLNENRII